MNGTAHECATGTVLGDLLDQLVGSTRGSAAAVDGEVVPRTQWPRFALRAGQAVEILIAVQGG